MSIHGLPEVPVTALPAAVRNGTSDDKQAYKAALGFEDRAHEGSFRRDG
jgi:hypothetical protein